MSHLQSLKSTLTTLSEITNRETIDVTDIVKKSSMCKVSYATARNKYLTQRVEEQMMDYSPPSVPTPPSTSSLLSNVVTVARSICTLQSDLDARLGKFEEGRSSLSRTVSEMTEDGSDVPVSEDFDEVDSDTVTDDITELEAKKSLLQKKLYEVQSKISESQLDLSESLATISEGGGDVGLVLSDKDVENVRVEKEKISADLVKTQETSQWYEAVRSAMEQLSGIKVSSIEAIKKNKGMMVKLEMGREGNHELNIILKAQKGGMKVDDAVLKGDKISDEFGIITCSMPTLTDLVAASAGMKAPSDLRFVIREASARLRNTVLKTGHVGKLRKRFEVKSSGERLDNLVVNVSEGVQANIRLTLDYPTCAGSCYVDSLLSANLPADELSKLRESVNNKRIEHVLGLVEDLVKGVREVALLGVGNTLGLGGQLPR
ncbi:hypothetical protein TrVE_jg7238 [Triparma verrucosa]|uniref:Uncharacterized protein n=1 Tax=Triparma verrucosa TaxID=1606542 RepID=A0A9W7BWJ3_9STRA|nr:hypothetical protein TrVE_jg7238 [Triparma verrucosa]